MNQPFHPRHHLIPHSPSCIFNTISHLPLISSQPFDALKLCTRNCSTLPSQSYMAWAREINAIYIAETGQCIPLIEGFIYFSMQIHKGETVCSTEYSHHWRHTVQYRQNCVLWVLCVCCSLYCIPCVWLVLHVCLLCCLWYLSSTYLLWSLSSLCPPCSLCLVSYVCPLYSNLCSVSSLCPLSSLCLMSFAVFCVFWVWWVFVCVPRV